MYKGKGATPFTGNKGHVEYGEKGAHQGAKMRDVSGLNRARSAAVVRPVHSPPLPEAHAPPRRRR
eukprot:scaffold224693_cov23-Tisochrysis_lutea.AAC.1